MKLLVAFLSRRLVRISKFDGILLFVLVSLSVLNTLDVYVNANQQYGPSDTIKKQSRMGRSRKMSPSKIQMISSRSIMRQ